MFSVFAINRKYNDGILRKINIKIKNNYKQNNYRLSRHANTSFHPFCFNKPKNCSQLTSLLFKKGETSRETVMY